MTETTLVTIIIAICGGNVTNSRLYGSASDVKEDRIACYEKLTNCAVGPNGLIMTFNEFNKKCVAK